MGCLSGVILAQFISVLLIQHCSTPPVTLFSLVVCKGMSLFPHDISCRDGIDDADSQGDGSSQPDTISIASRTSQNTVDSDKVGLKCENTWQVIVPRKL